MTKPRVAMIGLGMAGATCARRLAEAGFAVTGFDKGRGVGGRMALRRTPGLSFDHGVQFLRGRRPAFAAALAEWCGRGIAAPWGPGRVVGVPDMTAPVADLLAGLDIRTGHTVTRLSRRDGAWTLAAAENDVAGRYDAVVASLPAPQIARLLGASGLALPGIAQAAYAPCWTTMLALDGPLPFAGPDLRPGEGPIAYVADDGGKPGRAAGPTRVTVHASAAWSRLHLEDEREAVAAAMTARLADLVGEPVSPSHALAHRWRYALVEAALGRDCLYEPASRLGACGDWCLGPRVEDAYDSGAAMAARLVADFGSPAG